MTKTIRLSFPEKYEGVVINTGNRMNVSNEDVIKKSMMYAGFLHTEIGGGNLAHFTNATHALNLRIPSDGFVLQNTKHTRRNYEVDIELSDAESAALGALKKLSGTPNADDAAFFAYALDLFEGYVNQMYSGAGNNAKRNDWKFGVEDNNGQFTELDPWDPNRTVQASHVIVGGQIKPFTSP